MNRIETLLTELDETKAQLATATEQVAALTSDLQAATAKATAGDEAQTQLVQLTAELSALKETSSADKAALEAATAKVAELTSSQSDFDAKLAAEVAKLGLRQEPVQTPKPAASVAEIRATFDAMPAGPERSAFYAKHKDVLRYN